MYQLILHGLASKMELEEYYTLDEALKLHALMRMNADIEAFQAEDIQNERNR